MSIKAKLTAVAIATASSVFPFSVPSQADENGYLDELPSQADKNRYLDELDKLAKQQDIKPYLYELSAYEKLKRGDRYCTILESGSIKYIYSLFKEIKQYSLQTGYSDQIYSDHIEDGVGGEIAIIHASVKELCPEYKYKINNFMSEYSEEEEN
jgi:hypothetical protein